MKPTHKVHRIAVLACLHLLVALAGKLSVSQADDRPNLMFIYTDDQRFDALGANDNPQVRTPHLDRLCQHGTRFTNAHVVMSFVELYDLQSDPEETRNLSHDPSLAAIRERLEAEIQRRVRRRLKPGRDATLELLAQGRIARHFSGIYPHLASFNTAGECGTGAVVPWAGKLWWLTYSPHMPSGSDDKLYAARDVAGSVFLVGECRRYTGQSHDPSRVAAAADRSLSSSTRSGHIRVIPPTIMPGRLTGNARHLTDPANKVYYATMEEGFYEVDVKTLEVTQLFPDANFTKNGAGDLLPGYHGKGHLFRTRLSVYANNGEKSRFGHDAAGYSVRRVGRVARPWRLEGGSPQAVHRSDGPGWLSMATTILTTDPIWSIGWDHRSLILMLRDGGSWHSVSVAQSQSLLRRRSRLEYRMAADSRHRRAGSADDHARHVLAISQIVPRLGHTAGIAPRSTYLKVIGDFCRWNDTLVFGCDDAAKNEFLNTRKAKGKVAGPVAVAVQSVVCRAEPDRSAGAGAGTRRGVDR